MPIAYRIFESKTDNVGKACIAADFREFAEQVIHMRDKRNGSTPPGVKDGFGVTGELTRGIEYKREEDDPKKPGKQRVAELFLHVCQSDTEEPVLEGTRWTTGTVVYRRKVLYLPRCFAMLDFDCAVKKSPKEGIPEDIPLTLEVARALVQASKAFKSFGYTTASCSAQDPRFRIVFALDRQADTVADYEAATRRFAAALRKAVPNGWTYDGASVVATQMMYTPLPTAKHWTSFDAPVFCWTSERDLTELRAAGDQGSQALGPESSALVVCAEETASTAAAANAEWEPDEVMRELRSRGMVLGRNSDGSGWNVVCPCGADHQAGAASSSVYYSPSEANGFAGVFHCLHDHCRGRTQADFYAALGLDYQRVLQHNQRTMRSTKLPTVEFRSMADDWDNLLQGFAISHAKLPTGIPLWDSMLGGGLSKRLYVLGAIPGGGKSAIAHQIADALAQNGTNILYYSLEMSSDELLPRSLSRLTFEDAQCYPQDPTLPAMEVSKIEDELCGAAQGNSLSLVHALNRYKANIAPRFFVLTPEAPTIEQLETTVDEFLSKYPQAVVFIDYLQLLQVSDDRLNRDIYNKLKYISRRLKLLAQKLPVFIISSVNRSSYYNPASLDSFKDCGDIEFSCQQAFVMTAQGLSEKKQDEAKNKELVKEEDQGQGLRKEIVCVKNRGGRRNTTRLRFHGGYSYFERDTEPTEEEDWEMRKVLKGGGQIKIKQV